MHMHAFLSLFVAVVEREREKEGEGEGEGGLRGLLHHLIIPVSDQESLDLCELGRPSWEGRPCDPLVCFGSLYVRLTKM